MHLRPGQKVGALRIEHEIGSGAFGTVYLARDTLIGRKVALKLLPAEEGGFTPEDREHLLAEARHLGQLQSPHVVTLFRVHPEREGGYLLEMEFVPGGTLEDRIAREGRLEVAEAVGICHDICQGLRAAHGLRIIHGDVKPENVLLATGGRAKLTDFGVARRIAADRRELPLEGQIEGSPLYMAPEVIAGESTGMAADLWSAAVILYQLLSGRLPFDAESFAELAVKVRDEPPPPLPDAVPEPLRALVAHGLAKDPADRPASVEEVIEELAALVEAGAADPRVEEGPTNCVPPPTTFVGREAERAELTRLFTEEAARVVTLLGPGGIGKTRLSLEVGRDLSMAYEGGSWFVDLGEVFDRDSIAHAIAEVLRIPLAGAEDPLRDVADALRFRPPLLLVLDNCEQVREPAAEVVAAFRDAAPEVRCLSTSRILLGLPEERAVPIEPLSAGPEGDGFRLFVDRAREADPGFTADEEAKAEISAIVKELDGIPLALELAAARTRIMRPGQIAANLSRKFQLLKSTRRDVSRRHRTLTAVVDWSFDLLSDWEREAFLQACLFRDGFTVEAAEGVLELSEYPEAPGALDIAGALREKSLLTAFDAGPETRLAMYRSVRDYGEARWRRTAPEARQAELDRRHAGYYLDLAERLNARIPGFFDREAMDQLALEIGNLTAAQQRALSAGDGETAAHAALGLAETMMVRRPPGQLVEILTESLDTLPGRDAGPAARLLHYQSAACRLAGDWDRAARSADEAVAAARRLGQDEVLARALVEQGEIRRSRGDLEGAQESFDAGQDVAEREHLRTTLAMSIGGRGMVLGQRRDVDAAARCFTEAVRIARETGDHQTLVLHLHNCGVVHEMHADLDEAIDCYREAEDLARRHGNQVRAAVSIGGRANALAQRGDLAGALRCYAEAERIARDLGAKQRVAQITGNHGAVYAMAGRLGEAIVCYEEAEEIARELGDLHRVAKTLAQKARLHARLGDFESALAGHLQAEKMLTAIGDRLDLARTICERGSLLDEMGRPDEAEAVLRAGLAIYDELHASRSLLTFSYVSQLADLAARREDAEEAARLAREALDLAEHLGITREHGEAKIRNDLSRMRELVR